MPQRLFSPKCSDCRQKTMVLATEPYDLIVHHDGREYDVHVDALEVPRCSNCGAVSLDAEANSAIDTAFRGCAGLLTPAQILQGRKKLGLDQQQFADLLGVAVSTMSRWETGAQIQQRVMDGFLRALFEVKPLRDFLGQLHGVAAIH